MIYDETHQTPGDNVDYTLDFTPWLTPLSDTISTVSWTVPPGITQSNTSNTTLTASCNLSGGKPGARYVLDCQITTASTPARVKTASFGIRIEAD